MRRSTTVSNDHHLCHIGRKEKQNVKELKATAGVHMAEANSQASGCISGCA
ncbi:MAG: hypothetical protein P4M11_12030 [Candidatus Pacebacteria bacterium]|nr:hypothetical protein [Candidatus Paceibacterota bacterium]